MNAVGSGTNGNFGDAEAARWAAVQGLLCTVMRVVTDELKSLSELSTISAQLPTAEEDSTVRLIKL